MTAASANQPPAASQMLGRMPIAGGLVSLFGWALNTARAAYAAIWGPILVVVMTMDDSARFFERFFTAQTFPRIFGPMVIGSCLVFVGNRAAGRATRRCLIEALAALIGPVVLAFAVALVLISRR